MVASSSVIRFASALLLFGTVVPTAAQAQSVGTAFSGPTSADGASAWINPASMAAGEGTHIEVSGGISAIEVDYTPDNGLGGTASAPLTPLLTAGGFTGAIHPDWRVGITMGVPGTSGGQWSREGAANQVTRYYLVEGAIFQISIVPAVSWSPAPWLTVGAGANVVYSNMRMEQDKDLGTALNHTLGSTEVDSPFPYAHPDLASPVTASATGAGIGATGGVLVRPTEQVTLGASIHSPVDVTASGDLSVEYPERVRETVAGILPSAELPVLDGRFDVPLGRPLIVIGGVSVRPIEQLELTLAYNFEQRSTQPNLDVIITEASANVIENTTKPQAYTDRHRLDLRVAIDPIPTLRLALVGVYQTNSVPDLTMAPSNMDFERYEVGFAARWRIAPAFSATVQYNHVFLIDRTITESLYRPLAQHSLAAFNHPSPTGDYSASANTVRLALALHL